MSDKRLLTATIGNDTYELGEKYVLAKATNTILGGIKTGYINNENKYGIKLDNDGNAYVDVTKQIKTIQSSVATSYCIQLYSNIK